MTPEDPQKLRNWLALLINPFVALFRVLVLALFGPNKTVETTLMAVVTTAATATTAKTTGTIGVATTKQPKDTIHGVFVTHGTLL